MREWFESQGCPIKIQDDSRAFPVSDKSSDVIAVFERLLATSDFRLGSKVVSVRRIPDGRFELAVSKDGRISEERFDAVVVATGGAAYAKTGSEGGGYAFARELGHSVTALAPSLSAFETAEPWCGELAGLSLQNCAFRDASG